MRRLVLTVVTLATFAACGDAATPSDSARPNPPSAESLNEAATWLREFIDETAAQTFPGVPTQVEEDGTGRKSCDDGARTQDEDYVVSVNIPADQIETAFERARDYWESQGYRTHPMGEGTDKPRGLHLSR